MNKLIMTEWKGDVLTAQWTDGQIVRLSLDGRTSPSLLNRIYVGKVKNIVKNIGAAFIEFDGGMTGYYSLTENIKLAFDKAGIEIPFNQLEVHVKSDER